jgi:hypothetical protein
LASRYASHISDAFGKSSPLLADIGDNVAAAQGFAQTRLGANPELQQQVIDASNRAFMSGYHWAVGLAAFLLFATSAMVLRFLPARPSELTLPHDARTATDVAGGGAD